MEKRDDSAANEATGNSVAIRVNGKAITEQAIGREVQYHPASSREEAWRAACRALVIRELLLGEAARLGLEPQPEPGESRREALVRCLLEREVHVREPDEASCRRYFEKNRGTLCTPHVHTVWHILLISPEEALARSETHDKARELIAELGGKVERFAELAKRHSDCPSREAGGRMGRLRPGQSVPELERALLRLTPGEIAPAPIETRYGHHVVYLEAREGGRLYEFDEARPLVAAYLRESVHRRALVQYVKGLAERARIEGFELEGAETPLVQ